MKDLETIKHENLFANVEAEKITVLEIPVLSTKPVKRLLNLLGEVITNRYGSLNFIDTDIMSGGDKPRASDAIRIEYYGGDLAQAQAFAKDIHAVCDFCRFIHDGKAYRIGKL